MGRVPEGIKLSGNTVSAVFMTLYPCQQRFIAFLSHSLRHIVILAVPKIL
jgi:hypothetical protein